MRSLYAIRLVEDLKAIFRKDCKYNNGPGEIYRLQREPGRHRVERLCNEKGRSQRDI